jgi:aspartate-semialdehyde dehydrogenase
MERLRIVAYLAVLLRQYLQIAVSEVILLLISSFIELLAPHPYFEIHALGASSRSAGKEYATVTKWKLASRIPEKIRSMIVHECTVAPFKECGVVFSGLDQDVAGDIGECGIAASTEDCQERLRSGVTCSEGGFHYEGVSAAIGRRTRSVENPSDLPYYGIL